VRADMPKRASPDKASGLIELQGPHAPRSLKREIKTSDSLKTPNKRRKVYDNHDVQAPTVNVNLCEPPLGHLVWDSLNYSCAYDVFLMSLYCAFEIQPEDWCNSFRDLNGRTEQLHGELIRLRIQLPGNPLRLTEAREALRDRMSRDEPTRLPRLGPVMLSPERLLDWLLERESHLELTRDCNACRVTQRTTGDVSAFLHPDVWTTWANSCGLDQRATTASVQTWTSLLLRFPRDFQRGCPSCGNDGVTMFSWTKVRNPPPFLHFEVFPKAKTARAIASKSLRLPMAEGCDRVYRLHAFIYLNHAHFTVRVFDWERQSVWFHDGRQNSGRLVRDTLAGDIDWSTITPATLRRIQGETTVWLVYLLGPASGN
jgi:hypothetical protein